MSLRNEGVTTPAGRSGQFSRGAPWNQPDRVEINASPIWKRALDITCIILALPVLLPLLGGMALLICCLSPGACLYLQPRVGYKGRRFICFKFRTMKPGSDVSVHQRHLENLMKSDEPMLKMDANDPRLIPLGGFLRSTGLDELPQLLNVLGGQMSLVGPRPCVPYEYDSYTPEQKRRFDSVPGLTGLWQVNGKNNTSFARMIALDIEYAHTKSLLGDLKIMLQTVPALVQQVRETRARRRAGPAAPLRVPTIQPPSRTPAEPVSRVSIAGKLAGQK